MIPSNASLETMPPATRRSMPVQPRMRVLRHNYVDFFQPLPVWVWIVSLVFSIWAFTTPYPLLTAASVLALPFMASMLVFKGEPPILFLCCALQWLQAVAALFFCGIYGTTLDVALDAPKLEMAVTLSLVGIVLLALGMKLSLSSWARGDVVASAMASDSARLNISRVFWLWVASFLVGMLAAAVGWRVTSLHQFIVPFTNTKWVFFFILAYQALTTKKGLWYLGIAVFIEFANGLLGWFSSFKEVLFFFIVVAMGVRIKMSVPMILAVIAALVLGFVTSVFWSVIKQDYRFFISRGVEGAHGGGDMPIMQRVEWLMSRVGKIDSESFDRGTRNLLSRVSYIALFGNTLNHVPKFEPHARGELWGGAVKHVLMPRIIFRDKKVLDDSDRARRFTGLRLAGRESGTSIGIGYMAESYADFGKFGMFIPVFILGLIMGRVYQVATFNANSTLLGVAIGTAILFSAKHAFETSNVKIFGSLVLLCLAYWALNKFMGKGIMNWLRTAPLK